MCIDCKELYGKAMDKSERLHLKKDREPSSKVQCTGKVKMEGE